MWVSKIIYKRKKKKRTIRWKGFLPTFALHYEKKQKLLKSPKTVKLTLLFDQVVQDFVRQTIENTKSIWAQLVTTKFTKHD